MEFFVVRPEAVEFIHKLYDTNNEKIAADIEILKEWIKQQSHFPKITERNPNLYEIALMHSKYNVEKAKARFETHVTLRTVYRDFYQIIARDDLPTPSKLPLSIVPLPHQGPNFERLIMVWIKDPEACTFEHYVQSVLALLEIGTRYEYSNGYRIIYDCKNITFNLVTTTNFIQLRRLITLLINGYTSKFLGLHFFNAQPFIQIGIGAVKMVLKEKLVKRIIIHDNFETLYEIVPQKYLPEEYGGSAGNLEDILAKYDAAWEDNRDYLRKSDQYGSNESLRVGKLAENYSFGIEGTFKKLDLD